MMCNTVREVTSRPDRATEVASERPEREKRLLFVGLLSRKAQESINSPI